MFFFLSLVLSFDAFLFEEEEEEELVVGVVFFPFSVRDFVERAKNTPRSKTFRTEEEEEVGTVRVSRVPVLARQAATAKLDSLRVRSSDSRLSTLILQEELHFVRSAVEKQTFDPGLWSALCAMCTHQCLFFFFW
jgi:hypothetical protein